MKARRALICAPLLPEFDRESGGQRIFDLVMFLRDFGWAVSYCPQNPNTAGADRYVSILQQRGVAVYSGFNEKLNQLVASGQLDLVICAFWNVAEVMLPIVRTLSPQTKVVVDTIDLHFLRQFRRLLRPPESNEPVGHLGVDFVNDAARELNTYVAADAVFTVSEKESNLLNDMLGDPSLAYTVTDNEGIAQSPRPFEERSGILFIGNFRHPPNVEGVEFLCDKIIPRLDPALLERHPVYIVGNAPDDAVRGAVARCAKSTNVHLVGWVPSVLPYLHQARLTVVPLLHGAGTKRKLIQALMAGTPTVSTTIGTEGMDLRDEEQVLVASDCAAFANAIVRLLTDAELWNHLASQGYAHAGPRYSREAVRERFLRVISAVLAKRTKRMALSESDLKRYGPLVKRQYCGLVDRVCREAQAALPVGATVAVINKGDKELLKLSDLEAWHFPRGDDGGYAGYYPADSVGAIRHLEDLRAKGAQFLLLPRTAFWWMTSYPEFGRHLQGCYRELLRREDTCVIFDLREVREFEAAEDKTANDGTTNGRHTLAAQHQAT